MEQSDPMFTPQYRYNHSQKGLERWRRYDRKRGSRADYYRGWYHRIQDEAGCYMTVRDFFPAYRLLRALETAPVVEI